MPSDVLIFENGADTLKAGLASASTSPRLISNAAVRPKGSGQRLYIGHEIDDCRDFFGLYYRRPFERGILTDWDTEKAVWDKLLSPSGMKLDPRNLSLLVTEPYLNLPSVQETYDQLIFEEYDFESCLRCTPASTIPYGNLFSDPMQPDQPTPECCVVIDSGFSFTHIIPIMNGVILWDNVRRIDVGGKLLTNHLKQLVSFRHWDMMEHTYVMNQVKEACCYVSNSFNNDLEACQAHPRRNPIVQEYVLPDFSINRLGYIRSGPNAVRPPSEARKTPMDDEASSPTTTKDDPVLYMGNERFTVPEVLFHPVDVGLDQTGLAETVGQVIGTLPAELQGIFWANIGLIGGNFRFEGIVDRLLTELRKLAPPDAEVALFISDNPITTAFESAKAFASSPDYSTSCVTRAEYQESGSNACRRRFKANEQKGFGSVISVKDRERWTNVAVERTTREENSDSTDKEAPNLRTIGRRRSTRGAA